VPYIDNDEASLVLALDGCLVSISVLLCCASMHEYFCITGKCIRKQYQQLSGKLRNLFLVCAAYNTYRHLVQVCGLQYDFCIAFLPHLF